MSPAVAVAGAGPVGLMLACELSVAGVEVVVLERSPEPRRDALGMAINATVVELLHQRGLMDGLRPHGLSWPAAHFAHIPLDPARLTGRRENNFIVPQARLERRLEERAAELGIEVRRGTEVVGLSQDGTGVTVRVRTSGGAEDEPVRAAYLIGCDGADSTVRSLAGIGFPGEDLPFHGITGDLPATDALSAWFGAHQLDRGMFTVAPSAPGVLRVSTGEFGVEPADAAAPAGVAELRDAARRLTGRDLDLPEPHWLARWGHRTRQAERYRDGRVLLAGDAAHVIFPLGGQALSTGVEDAVNLAWKLAAALRGDAPAGLLDTYEAERHPVAARARRTTLAQSALMHPMDRIAPLRELFAELVELPQVNEFLVDMAAARDVRYAFGPDHPLVGGRLPDVPLTTASGGIGLAGTLHAARGVLLVLGDGAAPAEEAAGWAGRVDVVRAAPSAEIDATALLLRPDGRVAWAAGDGGAAGLRDALAAWFGDPVPAGAQGRL